MIKAQVTKKEVLSSFDYVFPVRVGRLKRQEQEKKGADRMKEINAHELRQIFKEQEENEEKAARAKEEAESIRAERLELERRKQDHKESQDRERLELLKAKEARARAREEAAQRQKKADRITSIITISVAAGTLIAGLILFAIILIKF